MPVMDAPRALIEQARLLAKANRGARAGDDDVPSVGKKRKLDKKVEGVSATASGIGFHGLTNGADTLDETFGSVGIDM